MMSKEVRPLYSRVIGKWKSGEEAMLKKVLKKAAEAARLFAAEGIDAATQFANTR